MYGDAMIVRYHESWRDGALIETFVCTQLELDALKAWGEYDHGSVLGKHSEVVGTFDDETLTILTDDEAFTAQAVQLGVVGADCPFAEQIVEHVECDEGAFDDLRCALGGDRMQELVALWGIEQKREEQ